MTTQVGRQAGRQAGGQAGRRAGRQVSQEPATRPREMGRVCNFIHLSRGTGLEERGQGGCGGDDLVRDLFAGPYPIC